MTGLVGFTREVAGSMDPLRLLGEMQSMLVHYPHNRLDRLWSDGSLYMTRAFNVIGQPEPQPYPGGEAVHVWMDGVFNNRDDVAARYGMREVVSDLDLLARLYGRSEGFDFLEQIDGFFAAVVYDAGKRQAHLISDRHGLRLLYWGRHRGGLWWSSELKTALALPDFEPRIDRQSAREFTAVGNIFNERTWFEGIRLAPTASVLTWDFAASTLSEYRYWTWNRIRVRSEPIALAEAAEELGRLFLKAVERRTPETRVNVELSGGLDSRAILAAVPGGKDVHAYTSGQAGCEDIRIATMAARTRGATHHVHVIDNANWISDDTLRDLWRQDGELGLIQLVGSRAHGPHLSEAPVRLNGLAGDTILGGDSLYNPVGFTAPTIEAVRRLVRGPDLELDLTPFAGLDRLDYFGLMYRTRRYAGGTVRASMTHGEIRAPIVDNDLVEFVYSLPDRLRYRRRLYREMLMMYFPAYYKTIPWQRTGVTVDFPSTLERVRRLPQKMRRVFFQYARKLGWIQYRHNNPRLSFVDAPRWLREEPSRTLFETVLLNRDAVYPAFLSREHVVNLWQRHQRGADHSKLLCYYFAAEVWLQQVFTGRFRPSASEAEQAAR